MRMFSGRILDHLDSLPGYEYRSLDTSLQPHRQPPHPTTGHNMVAESLRRFKKLPTEVEVLMWEHAAISSGTIDFLHYFGFCFGSTMTRT